MPRAAITDLYRIDDMLEPEERAARDAVAAFVDKEYIPIVGKHFRNGTFPMDVVPRLAELERAVAKAEARARRAEALVELQKKQRPAQRPESCHADGT